MVFILITLFIDILGIGIIVPVLPELVKELIAGDPATVEGSISEQAAISRAGLYVGVIGAAYATMQFFFAPILGSLSDRFGRRPIILASLFGLGIDFLIQGLAPNIAWLFVGRIFAGIMGASFTAANAYIADVSAPENRARNYGLVGMMFGLGFTIGPAFGGMLSLIGLRVPFFVAAGLALVNWLYGYFVLPESLPPENRSSFSFRKANPLGALIHLRKYPLVAGLAVVFVCTSLAQRGLENVWVLYTSFRYDWGTFANGLALCLVGMTSSLVQGGMVRPAVQRFGERRTATLGIAVSGTAFLCYGLASQGWMIPLIIIFGSPRCSAPGPRCCFPGHGSSVGTGQDARSAHLADEPHGNHCSPALHRRPIQVLHFTRGSDRIAGCSLFDRQRVDLYRSGGHTTRLSQVPAERIEHHRTNRRVGVRAAGRRRKLNANRSVRSVRADTNHTLVHMGPL